MQLIHMSFEGWQTRLRGGGWIALAAIAAGVIGNEVLVAHYLSADGVLEPHSVATLRALQAALVFIGLGLLLKDRRVIAGLMFALTGVNLWLFVPRGNS